MPKAKFRCKRCKRSFSMAAHLARHMNTIHATTKRKASATSGSEGIIDAMQNHHNELLAERTSLDAQIDAFARAMETIGAATPTGVTRPAGKKRGRPVGSVGRPGSLKSYIDRVLRQSYKPMSLKDIGTRVKKAGFKTKAKDLTKAVSNTLPGLKKVKRVGYGKYQLAG